jgi:hypothetical protein
VTPHMTLQTVGDADAASALAGRLWAAPMAMRAMRLKLAQFLPVQVLSSVVL